LNEVSPAATSCANAPADDAITITPASTNPFIVPLLADSRQAIADGRQIRLYMVLE
jgi:hypothetical protein